MTINKYFHKIKSLVLQQLQDQPIRIFIFGSRANNTAHAGSDLDIGIEPYGEFDTKRLNKLRELLENSTIPYKIDVVDFRYVSDDFKKLALQDIIIWKN